MIRVLIVDDSPTQRLILRSHLEKDPEIQIIAEARNGKEAVNLCMKTNPDIITMDIQMPYMNGYDAIRLIMAKNPRPIVVLTSTESDIKLGISFNAIQEGALMVLGKPKGYPKKDEDPDNLVAQIKAMAKVKVVGRRRNKITEESISWPGPPSPGLESSSIQLIAIGASTGGPPALLQILRQLPANLSIPIVIVQHISAGFVTGLAQWLERSTSLKIKVAENGKTLRRDVIYLAPDNRHLVVGAKGLIWLMDSDPVDSHRPSVTALFNSVAQYYGPSAMGILLTGMGRDGARGLKNIHDAGGHTIAQNEATSIVFGMPKEAIKMNAAKEILSLLKIGPRIKELIMKNDKLQSKI